MLAAFDEAFESLDCEIAGEVRCTLFWCLGASNQKAILAQVAIDLEEVVRVVPQYTSHLRMESLSKTDVLVEFVLLCVDLLMKLISDSRIVVFINVLQNFLALLLERIDPLTESRLDVVRVLVVNELEILSLNLARVKVVDSVANTSSVAFLLLFDIHVCVVFNLAIIILLREDFRIRTDILLQI